MPGRRISHYLLERLLGAGGMGEVHLARDLALGRPTALKILPRGFDPIQRSRLLEEARISARLQHPAIATFYEAGEEEGEAFIAMEYVPGETLRSRLRGGALPAPEAMGLVASLLEGLVHAHALGVLHRDIKPENVMVAGSGLGRLLDFGIAKQLSSESAAPAAQETALTEQGLMLGTPGYMAPEQIHGVPASARSDLFAVGALLHETITGRRLFDGGSASERMAQVLTAPVPPLEPQGAPRGIDALLARALEKNPADRFASASEFLVALQEIGSGGRASAMPDTVAVVDLENASADPADAWIGSAVAEQLTGDLARVSGLQVVARERVLRSRGAAADGSGEADALERARTLGCRWLLSGSFQRVGPALRLSTRLTEVPTARVVTSVRLDGSVAEIFSLQDRLAAAVVRSFPLDLASMSARTSETPQIGAYELYATGKRLFHRLQKGTFADAKRQFERAIELDPRFAPPHSGLAAIHAMHFTYMTDTKELELAEAYARRSIELDPDHGDAYSWLSYACWRLGRPEEALAAAKVSERLAPDSSYGDYFAACTLWSIGRKEEAVEAYQRAVLRDRQHAFAWMALGMLLGELGRFQEAEWCVAQAIAQEGQPGSSPTTGASVTLGEVFRLQGRHAEARRACLEGITAAEQSDHMYRDSMRTMGLVMIGTIALEQSDREAAQAAFTQAVAHLKGRPRTLGGRHFLVRALAGLSRVNADQATYHEAKRILDGGDGYDNSWLWCARASDAWSALAAAAEALGRSDEAAEFRRRS